MRPRTFNGFWKRALFYALACVGLFLLTNAASAADSAEASFKVLDAIDAAYKPFQTTWYNAIKVYAMRLFGLLMLVDFSWSTIVWVMDKQEVPDIVWALVRKCFSFGFFAGLLRFSDTWVPAIIDSLRQIGQEVGETHATPDGVVYKGYEVATGVFRLVDKLNLTETIVVGIPVIFVALVIFAAFLVVAAQLLVTLIESYLVVGAGVILLGFGGSRWTTEFATKYLQHAFGTGLKLMMLYLVIGAGQTIVTGMVIDANHLIQSMLAMLGIAAVYAYLAIHVPKLAGAMMSGSPAMTAGDLASTAITVGAAIVGTAALAGAGGKAAAGLGAKGLTGAAGLAQALGAGYNASLDMGKSGLSAAAGAVGEVAKHGLGLGVNSVGDALKGGAASISDKVANTTGGQIASSIEASRGGSISGSTPSAQGGDAPSPASGSSPVSPTSSSASSSGTSPAAPAASKPSGSATSSTPVGDSGTAVNPPSMPASTSSAGDASSASIGPGSTPSSPANAGAQAPQKAAMHERIRDLQGYVPQDMAQGAAINIQTGHAAD